MPTVWQYAIHDDSLVKQLCSKLQISPLTAQVLVSRGYETDDSASQFLNANLTDLYEPETLPGVSEATTRIVNAIREGRRITIYGDYDVDGMTATSILWHCLKLENAQVDYHIPSRITDGYGLSEDALKQLHAEDPNRLVVTVDCGITSVKEAALAKELGLELVVTDHHEMRKELPPAACLVHPGLPGSNYPFRGLCGAGVAFKLAWAVCKKLGTGERSSPRMKSFLLSALGLAAIGTIADVVPLVNENRIIVRYGLQSLATQASVGLQELMKVAKVEPGKLMQSDDDIAFKIAPRLNAAGRLGQARLGVELLSTDDANRAKELAEYLDVLNKNRRSVETKILKKANALVAEHPEWLEERALVLAHRDWHPGVIGIVANRLAEKYEKPTFLISLNSESSIVQGSGRSFGNFNLKTALEASSQHLISHGGHAAAAGLRIDAGNIDAFRDQFCIHAKEQNGSDEPKTELHVDAEVRLADVSRQAVLELDRLGPFGHKNSRPIFVSSRVELSEPPRKMGEGERHLSLLVRQYGKAIRAVAFGRGEWADDIEAINAPFSICYSVNLNRFRGRESVQLQLRDWQSENST